MDADRNQLIRVAIFASLTSLKEQTLTSIYQYCTGYLMRTLIKPKVSRNEISWQLKHLIGANVLRFEKRKYSIR